MNKNSANAEIKIKPKLITTSQDSYRLYDQESFQRSVNTSKALYRDIKIGFDKAEKIKEI